MNRKWLLLAAVAVELLLLRLGFWQWSRASEKQTQRDHLEAVLAERRGIALSGLDADTRAVEWAEGRLRFLPGPLLLLDNQRRADAVGVVVYQLAENADGRRLLVELGWLPVGGDRRLPSPAPLQGEFAVRGLLLPPPAMGIALGPPFSAQPDGSLLLLRVDTRALAAHFQRPLAARVLRLDPALPLGFSRDLAIQANTLTPEKHRGYAVQWFGMAAAFALLCGVVWRRRKHDNR